MFFDRFREALSRLPAGLIRPGPPASESDVFAAEARLGKTLPPSFVAFLRSFDGVDLFHESIVIGGVGPRAARPLGEMRDPQSPDDLVFAEVLGGDRFAFDGQGRVLRLRGAPPDQERWRAGGEFERWLDGIVAHQRVLYGPDGEFSPDAFEPDGAEVMPLIALRQTERALRACDDSAEWHHERGVALRRLGRLADARDAFTRAAALDPQNPWPRFDAGRAALELGPATAREARLAFSEAAGLEAGESRARFWVWAARAALLGGEPEQISACRSRALAQDPGIGEALHRARDAARADDDDEALGEAEALLAALESPIPAARARLPVLSGDVPPQPAAGFRAPKEGPPATTTTLPKKAAPASGSTRRTPPADPRRPRPAERRPRGAPRPGSRR